MPIVTYGYGIDPVTVEPSSVVIILTATLQTTILEAELLDNQLTS